MIKIIFILRLLIHKNITNFLLKISNKIYLKGNFTSWGQAINKCNKGYDSEIIFEKIKHNFLKSLKNSLYYERDGLLLKKNDFINDDLIIKYYSKLNKQKKILKF